MFSGLTHNIDGKNTLAWYVQRTSRTVSLSHQHLITFNVCVWRTTKAWITVPGRPCSPSTSLEQSEPLGEVFFLRSSRWQTSHICPSLGLQNDNTLELSTESNGKKSNTSLRKGRKRRTPFLFLFLFFCKKRTEEMRFNIINVFIFWCHCDIPFMKVSYSFKWFSLIILEES